MGCKRRQKILFVIGTLDIGGTEKQLVELACGLDANLFEVVVVCLSSGGPLAERLLQKGIRLQVLGFRGSTVDPIGFFRELWRFVQLLRCEKPDIVHAFLYWGYVVAGFASRIAGEGVFIASRRSLGKFKEGKAHLLLLERLVNRWARLFIANSLAVRDDACLREKLPLSKVKVIYNGVRPIGGGGDKMNPWSENGSLGAQESEVFVARQPCPSLVQPPELSNISNISNLIKGTGRLTKPGSQSSPDDLAGACSDQLPDRFPRVLVLANLYEYKGHSWFLRVWKQVLRHFPDGVALLVGDGPMRESLEKQVQSDKLENSVRFLGSCTGPEMWLEQADILVHPSSEEGFCNAILEGMAWGKAIVATQVGGNSELLRHGEDGLLVPYGCEERLVQAIVLLSSNPKLRENLGMEARERVAREFSMNAMIRQYEQMYSQVRSV